MGNLINEDLVEASPKYLIRPARYEDKQAIKDLIWEFTLTEALELDTRIIVFRVIVTITLVFFFFVFHFWRIPIYGNALRITVFVAILFQIFYTFQLLSFMLFGTNSTWQKYWVVEVDKQVVACALLNNYTISSELAYLFVKPRWRRQGIASSLIKNLIKEAPNPLFLACKPKMVKFYAKLGFIEIGWHNLSQPVQQHFSLFQPHPKLWGYPIIIMKHKGYRKVKD